MTKQLSGRKILVVEDSPVVASFAQDVLEELGCTVLGPAGNMADARTLAESEDIDAALVDLRIRGDKSFPICEILRRRGIPFVLTSGYADWTIPVDWADRPQLPKPYKQDVEVSLIELLH
jgi:CheY-like chemotaxis protein